MQGKDKVALVTGGYAGIGKAIAVRLAAQCRAVVVVGRRDTADAESVRTAIARLGCRPVIVRMDLAKYSEIAAGLESTLADLGGVDILVNNAGISGFMGPVVKTPIEQWDELLAVNLSSVFALCKHLVPGMIESGWGRVINISSIAYRQCLANTASYNVAKAAINALTKTLSREVAASGITVNAVAPGLVLTDRIKNVRLPGLAASLGVSASDIEAKMTADTDTKRLTTTKDIAEIVAFLATDAARNISGQVIDVAGGF